MRVRQLIGKLAGEVVEMNFAEAQACLAAGTACLPHEDSPVRGLVFTPEPVAGDTVPAKVAAKADGGEPAKPASAAPVKARARR